MEINRETANRLWVKQFGRKVKARDFAGREIDKAAYDCRNSKYGWNVDHIYPESKGGKTNDSNLICCHMKTNSEKADKFPCFSANGKQFEIRRRQNHYEIFEKNGTGQSDIVNFYDAGQGIEAWNSCEKEPEYTYIGYAKINLDFNPLKHPNFNRHFRNFLGELFRADAIFSQKNVCYSLSSESWTFTVVCFDVPLKEDTQTLLDQCILLNTYAQYLFEPSYGCKIRIFCGLKPYDSRCDITWRTVEQDIIYCTCESFQECFRSEHLAIHGMVKCNTNANNELENCDYHPGIHREREGYFPYNVVFTDLAKRLEKLR